MALIAATRAMTALHPGDVLVVIHDFDARSPDELTLRKSERVELVELDDGFGDGWYLGKHLTHGVTGLFPGVYTTKVSVPTRASAHVRQASGAHERSLDMPGNATTSHGGYEHISNAADPYNLPTNLHEPTLPDSSPDGSSSGFIVAPVYDSARTSLPVAHHTTYVQRSIGEALGEEGGEESPVMNETLSVIDEHITDLSTPRQSLTPLRTEDSESEYSSNLERRSFVAGPETDEEDNATWDEDVVRNWDHLQTAQQLREIGVDAKHIQIFQEQEITGDVLLDMDQSFLNMKEYDFGVMGRRLKTWHKIRDFQRDVKGTSSTQIHDRARDSGRTTPSIDTSNVMPQPLQPQSGIPRTSLSTSTPPTSWRVSTIPESPNRLSMISDRETKNSRRHSSIDFSKRPDLNISPDLHTDTVNKSNEPQWTSTEPPAVPPVQISMTQKGDGYGISGAAAQTVSPIDLERGYFSGNEIDHRKTRSKLSKRDSPSHSRQPSAADESRKKIQATKRHSRLSSVDSIHEPISTFTSRAAKAYHSSTMKGRYRSSSTRVTSTPPMIGGVSPTVTNLEGENNATLASPMQEKRSMQERAKKLMGFRAVSETIVGNEKTANIRTGSSSEQAKGSLNSPTTSTTPSQTSRSVELDNTDASSKGTETAMSTPSQKSTRPRPKGKLQTSAYTHGLLKISPQEARKACDHFGWMKKKSSGIMTTWKPRLFILRGRRLSYYYSENDTEERGIIDISGHKVLVANNDPITTLHASVTGATSKPSPSSQSTTSEGSPVATKSSPAQNSGPFFFKLIPPKTGLSRAVQFTKPTIHYFQVDSISEGRKWMGEIMKATITHDLTSFETTNKQKTISLAKAKERRERPPALDDTKSPDENRETTPKTVNTQTNGPSSAGTGLNIHGLDTPDTGSGISLSEALGIAPTTLEEEKEQVRTSQSLAQPEKQLKDSKDDASPRDDESDKENTAATSSPTIIKATDSPTANTSASA